LGKVIVDSSPETFRHLLRIANETAVADVRQALGQRIRYKKAAVFLPGDLILESLRPIQLLVEEKLAPIGKPISSTSRKRKCSLMILHRTLLLAAAPEQRCR
jgi:hypothetical protein